MEDDIERQSIMKDGFIKVAAASPQLKVADCEYNGEQILEMVKEAGIGIAVNNSYDDLKNVATYVTKASDSEGAFAEAISKFIN